MFLKYVHDPPTSHIQVYTHTHIWMNMFIHGYIYVYIIYKCKYIHTEKFGNILQYYDLFYYTYLYIPFSHNLWLYIIQKSYHFTYKVYTVEQIKIKEMRKVIFKSI